jgi:WD40 repeat protein
MIDERDLFARAAERFDPPRDAYERFQRREDRRQHNRRAGTIVVAIVLMAIVFGGIARAIEGARRERPVAPAPSAGIFDPVRGWIAYFDPSVGHVQAVDPSGGVPPVDLPGDSPPLAWSPDGAHLLLRDGSVVNPDGSITQAVPKGLSQGSFSPDGKQILFQGSKGLYVTPVDGTGQPQLVVRNDPGAPQFLFAEWSPDGSTVAYWATLHGGWGIWLMRTDGSDRREILDLSGGRVGEMSPLAWSPDGTTLAFAIDPFSGSANPSSVGVVNADGSGFRMLTDRDGGWGPVWSPDGSRIAFVRNDLRVYTMTRNGHDIRRARDAVADWWQIAWNPLTPL